MYSIDKQEQKNIEIDVHPLTKWKRVLLYLADMVISFILSYILLNIAVMPLSSLIYKTDTQRSYEAEKMRDDILYEYELLFYREGSGSKYPQYKFDANLSYTCYRFIAYYVFDDDTSLDPDYPEYSHWPKNEVIWTYFHTIRNDDTTYYEIFDTMNQQYSHFDIVGNVISLKSEVKDEIRVFYKPNESLGKKGKTYFAHLESLFSGLFGKVIKDIYANDLVDSHGNSFADYQRIIKEVSLTYYWKVSICCLISYLLSWVIMHLLIPLLNSNGYTITSWVMKTERLGFRNLLPLSKKEVAISSAYYLLLDMPYLFFLSLSYTTLVYAFSVPMLPILSLISGFVVLVSLFVVLFNSFNRSISDLLSQTVYVPSDDVDSVIKARETVLELKMLEEKKNK